MELFIDPGQRRGVAKELFEQLRDAIVGGQLRDGDRVPPSRDLARQLGISRHTVTTVYARLVAEGFLEGRAGGGTHVAYGGNATPRTERPTELRPRPFPSADYVTAPPGSNGIDLRIGLPDRALFPLEPWRRSVVSAMQRAPAEGGEPAGHPELRRTLAHWIGRSRGVLVDPSDVVVTNGAQHAVDLVARVIGGPGDVVAFEEPGYAPMRDLLGSSGFRVVPVPVDDEGIVVDAIPSDARIVYVTPSHQSPTGATMSLGRRRALLDLAERLEMAVIEDDYDSEYRHVDRPLEPLFRLDRSGRVVYVGTLSKVLSPTLRLGFAALPRPLVPAAARVAAMTGAYPPTLLQVAVHEFVADGHLDRHLRRARRTYAERFAVADALVAAMVADGLLLAGPRSHTGLHLAARLPHGVAEGDVLDGARRHGVALTSMAASWSGAPGWQALLVGFGRAEPAQLERGLAIVRDALRR